MRKFIPIVFILSLVLNSPAAQAKSDDDQTQIILLNDSAAALEDSNPGLSKSLTQFANEKEKEWEEKSANKDALPAPVTAKDIPRLEGEIKLLKAAALAVGPTYPLIVEGLHKMARGINRAIEQEYEK